MSKNFYIYIGLILFLFSCKKERSDIIPHIIIDLNFNETLRIDYYESGDYIVIYFNDSYKDKGKLLEAYAQAIFKAKNFWCFRIMDFVIASPFEVDEIFKTNVKRITEDLLSEDVYMEERQDQKGFFLKLNKKIGNCDSR